LNTHVDEDAVGAQGGHVSGVVEAVGGDGAQDEIEGAAQGLEHALLAGGVVVVGAGLPCGVSCGVGLPTEPVSLPLRAFVNGGKSFAGSQIGGIAETQEMLGFCGAPGALPPGAQPHTVSGNVEVSTT